MDFLVGSRQGARLLLPAGVAESPWKQLQEIEIFQGLGRQNKVQGGDKTPGGSRGDR